ncbi:hypothetical protein H0H93_008508 [Arthromyces matolae]|nr:hypothetical protein H0H93_008508 [Arthromyces matolae]
MKPTTTVLILLASPIPSATPIPPTNDNLDFRRDAIPNPQVLMPSFSARDASIVDSGHSRFDFGARDSSMIHGGSNVPYMETLLFSRMLDFEEPPPDSHPPPQLVFEDSLEVSIQASGQDQVTRQELEKQLKETQYQLKTSPWETEHHDVVIHLMDTNDALVSLDLELVTNGKLTYYEYRPKMIHILTELVKFSQSNWNLFDISACARKYIDKYLEVEALHKVVYECMDRRGSHSPTSFGEELLKELEEQRDDMVAEKKGIVLSDEERKSKSSQLLNAALSNHYLYSYLNMIKTLEKQKKEKNLPTILALREVVGMRSLHVESKDHAESYVTQLREIVKVAKGNPNPRVRMYAKAICRHLCTAVSDLQQKYKTKLPSVEIRPQQGFHLEYAGVPFIFIRASCICITHFQNSESATTTFNVLLLPRSLKRIIPNNFTAATLADLAHTYSKASLTNDEKSEKNVATSWQLWTMVARIFLDYGAGFRPLAQTIVERMKNTQLALEPAGELGRRLDIDAMVKYLEGELNKSV